MMNILSRLFFLFTPMILLLSGINFVMFCHTLHWLYLLGFFSSLYVIPVLCYNLQRLIIPIKEGIAYREEDNYSFWIISYHFQCIYYLIPFLESSLRLIPGLFSFWLRLWGSKIGKNVIWTPEIGISDRGFLEIGDNAFFGNGVQFFGHIVTPKKNKLRLYIKTICVGNNVFVGGYSFLAPGVAIEDGTIIQSQSTCSPTKDQVKKIMRQSQNTPKKDTPNQSHGIP